MHCLGSASQLVMQALGSSQPSKEELDEIQNLLNNLKKSNCLCKLFAISFSAGPGLRNRQQFMAGSVDLAHCFTGK